MTAAQCPICLATATLTREHVWPRWFLKRMDEAAPPPLGWSINGVPVEDRDGNQIKGERRQRVMLDICGPCNDAMNTVIEVPAKPIVSALALNRWRGRYRREEWRKVGLWWAKVLLLIAHEGAQLENARLQKAVKYSFEPPMPDLHWLTDGTGVPDHVSVFVHNADMTIETTEFDLSIPAQVNFPDGRTAYCHVLTMATPGLCATVVSHPGIRIDHPLVKRRQAWELLHSPPRSGNLGKLKPLGPKHVKYFRGGGVPNSHVADESEFSFLSTLFGYESDQIAPPTFFERAKGRFRRPVSTSPLK